MMNQLTRFTLLTGFVLGQAVASNAADPDESDYYQIDAIPMPDGVVVETSGIEMLPNGNCLLYTSPSPRDRQKSRMPSSA